MLWLKAFHIISVVCWFAGLFYLPRLFVYHTQASDEISLERFKIMERKLYYGIMAPAALFTIFFGVGLASIDFSYYLNALWFELKLVCILLLLIFHLACGKYLKDFKHDCNKRSTLFFRWFNEIPTVLLIIIVILVCVKKPL